MTLSLALASRAAPRRAYKGAWRGLHIGTRADTTWSPRLSPMHVLQGNMPWAVSGSAMGLPSVVTTQDLSNFGGKFSLLFCLR
jgi:hypothetical protein